MDKIWEIAPKINKKFQTKFPDIDPVVLQILFNRGLKTKKEIENFLYPDYKKGLHDPFLFNDMKKAVDRILKAKKNKEKVFIFTDSDTDGATAGALMFKLLKYVGIDDLTIFSADRNNEGYGLNIEFIDKLVKEEVGLMLTCDSGITNVDEIKKAQKNDIDVIVTDHHQEPKKVPPAFAILNPKLSNEAYPFQDLAGVGVAFKLAQAVLSDKRFKLDNPKAFEKWLLDLVAVGTIVDHMPIVGENRNLVKFGMIVLNKTSNCGLRKLLENINLELGNIKARDVAFRIGPRLNVPGRIDCPDESLNLLLSDDPLKARKRINYIEELNRKRRNLVQKNLKKIIKEIGLNPKDKILLVESKLQSGLLGLVAMRVMEKYNKPTIVLSSKKDKIRGSGRSLPGLDFLQVIKTINQECFADLGGHKRALGFSIRKEFLNEFRDGLKKAELSLDKQERPRLNIDAKISLENINWDVVDKIEELKPFGVKNPKPLFLVENLHLSDFSQVGKNGNHNRLSVKDNTNGDFGKMIYFASSQIMKDYNNGDKVDIVFRLGTNIWNGRKEIQMTVVDIKKA